MRALSFVALSLTLLLAAPAVAAAPIRATITTSSAKPVVDQPWRWAVKVSGAAGQPLVACNRPYLFLQLVRS